MPLLHPTHILILGAGAAGLMTARELLRAGKSVTILDARDQCAWAASIPMEDRHLL
jgi:glycine/D-amino acid oxidase-like deaminating enzyme